MDALSSRVRGPLRSAGAAIALTATLSLFGASALAQGVVTLETPAPPGSQPSAAPDASPTPPSDPQEAMLAYVQCMREHGVDMPDPEFTADGGVVMRRQGRGGADDGPGLVGGPGDPAFQEAQDACGSLMEGQVRELDPERQAEAQARALEFAQCMREHGVDMPDPQFESGGGIRIQVGGPGSEFDPETMQAAQEACNELMAPPPPAGDDADGSSDQDGAGTDTQGEGLPEASGVIP